MPFLAGEIKWSAALLGLAVHIATTAGNNVVFICTYVCMQAYVGRYVGATSSQPASTTYIRMYLSYNCEYVLEHAIHKAQCRHVHSIRYVCTYIPYDMVQNIQTYVAFKDCIGTVSPPVVA